MDKKKVFQEVVEANIKAFSQSVLSESEKYVSVQYGAIHECVTLDEARTLAVEFVKHQLSKRLTEYLENKI